MLINKSLNFYSVKKTFNQIQEVDSSIILIDSQEGIDRQDKRIINLITEKSKTVIIIFNKIDLIKQKAQFQKNIINEIEFTHSYTLFYTNI